MKKSRYRSQKRHTQKLQSRYLLQSFVLVPRINRGGSDLTRIPGVVCRVAGYFFEICTKYDKLNDCLRSDDLDKYHGVIDFDNITITNKISMRELARKFSNRTEDLKDIEISCNCNGKCGDRRCSCFLHDEDCNSHCHLKSTVKGCCTNNFRKK